MRPSFDADNTRALLDESIIYGDLSPLGEIAPALGNLNAILAARVVTEAAWRVVSSDAGDGEKQDFPSDSHRSRQLVEELVSVEEWKECRRRAVLAHRQQRALRFLHAVDHAGGFYYHRWGDAEIHTLLVAIVAEPHELAFAESLPYQHYFNYHCPLKEESAAQLLKEDERSRRRGEGDGILHQKFSSKVFEHQAPVKYLDTCETAARASFPQLKDKGSARMSPAEMPNVNGQFGDWVRSVDGGPIQLL
jgi:hypothetical protein